MAKLYKELLKYLAAGDFSLLAETHATSAGLKAVSSAVAADGIEECRKACGGHGYSMFSGIPSIFASYVPATTYEGDNYVLLQQTARYLIKAMGQLVKGKNLSGNAKYLEVK
jgi:acyl-CoA oxidase